MAISVGASTATAFQGEAAVPVISQCVKAMQATLSSRAARMPSRSSYAVGVRCAPMGSARLASEPKMRTLPSSSERSWKP